MSNPSDQGAIQGAIQGRSSSPGSPSIGHFSPSPSMGHAIPGSPSSNQGLPPISSLLNELSYRGRTVTHPQFRQHRAYPAQVSTYNQFANAGSSSVGEDSNQGALMALASLCD
jgi:hypothetical protein